MARRLEVELVGDSRSLERAFARSARSAEQFQRKITRTVGGVAAAFGVGLGLSTVVDGLKSVTLASSNLAESMSKNRAVFGDSAKQLEDWSKTTATAFGVSERAALETASTFGALFGPLGIIGHDAAQQSRRLTELGADLASFYNTDVASALDAIRSGLVGEAEPLRRYGVLLSETRVAEEALSETHKKHVTELTVQEKALARIALIFRDTAVAQGDFGRTSGGLAGQQKILQAQIEDLKAAIGDQLRPEIVKAMKATNAWLGKPGNREQIIEGTATAVRDLAAAYQTLAAAIETVKSVQGTRSDFQKWLGHAGFAVAGPVSWFKMWKKANEDLVDALGMDSGRGGGQKLPAGLRGPIGATGGPAGPRGPLAAAVGGGGRGAVPDMSWLGKTTAFIDKWLAVGRKAAAAAKAKAAAERAAERYQTRMETRGGWLAFAVERAEDTKRISDDIKAQRNIEAWLLGRIKTEGRKLELVSELWRTRKKIRDLNKSKAVEGDPLAGLMQVSSKQLANMLAAGTGLDVAGRRRLGANIAGAELRPLTIHNPVYLDGREVARSVNTHNARTGHRTASQTSGRRG